MINPTIKDFMPLTSSLWQASSIHTAKINGRWAEDDTTYEITAPPQLVDSIVAMQNFCYSLHEQIVEKESAIYKMQVELHNLKKLYNLV